MLPIRNPQSIKRDEMKTQEYEKKEITQEISHREGGKFGSSD
jgi:hypothetical protein